MTGITSDTSKSAIFLAQNIANQVAAEPWEILKTARQQVGEKSPVSIQPDEGAPPPLASEKLSQKDKALGTRQVEALNRELADIARDKLLKELQRKIAQGGEVYLEEYPQLSPEQKQVLQAEIEAVRVQKQNAKNGNDQLVEPVPKKSRRLFDFGRKTQAERQQTRVERPLPPSG